MNPERNVIDAVSIVGAESASTSGTAWIWGAIAIVGVLLGLSCLAGFLFAAFRGRSVPLKNAWRSIASQAGLSKEDRVMVEAACEVADLSPCAIALCPSQIERLLLMNAGQPNLESLARALAKLHPHADPDAVGDLNPIRRGELTLRV